VGRVVCVQAKGEEQRIDEGGDRALPPRARHLVRVRVRVGARVRVRVGARVRVRVGARVKIAMACLRREQVRLMARVDVLGQVASVDGLLGLPAGARLN